MAPHEINIASLIAALSRPEAYSHAVDAVEVHQTHASAVFLAGDFAYKIKKPVNLGFLDFSTLEKRKHDCDEEVRLNRRLAPHVYLGVIPVAMNGDALAIGQCGRVIEWAVQMKRLPPNATLESRLARGEVSPEQVRALAVRLADFHQHAERSERISTFAKFDAVARNARENFVQAMRSVGVTTSSVVFERVWGLTEWHLTRHRDLIEARHRNGAACDTHGDLHLDHVYCFPGEPPPNDLVVIDCIEFNEQFRFADPIADMSFLAMDLAFHGRRDLARIFTDAYFAASGDEGGRALVPLYSAYRAVVRAKVEAIVLHEEEIAPPDRHDAAAHARAHWLLALGLLEQPVQRPVLILVGGLPGTGKSTLAHQLAESGNLDVLRSDTIPKETAFYYPEGSLYSAEATERTYTAALARCEQWLIEGRRVIVDANFRNDTWRRAFVNAARRLAAPVYFLVCQAERNIVQERLGSRVGDASDANWATYQQLESTWQPIADDLRDITMEFDTSAGVFHARRAVLARMAADGFL